ncbi:MAG: aminotransferase class V-fold PLP-dependent enzyme [Anaerolineaceae bacterium]|nr:aminotransferase class V-fold PLP-dependent enzyme [Anaerolineaceae bacterium]
MQSDWLLNPDITFLNHGSFGACPRPVFETYQRWQLELERQPVEFMGRRYHDLMNAARQKLANYINAAADDLIFVPNATVGINLVARSLKLQAGDVIVMTDHEYGAIHKTWEFIANKTGAELCIKTVPLPLTDPQQVVDALFAELPERTAVIAISHLTSPTAVILPIADICQRARQQGILTVIDGAHAPGQLPLDLAKIGADFYTGNCHKWLCAPKGSGFLHARSEHHAMLDPLVISWGWGWPDNTFVNANQWQGTRDVAAYLSVPAAIEYQQAHDWPVVRARCHKMAIETMGRINQLTGLPAIATDDFFAQMSLAALPPIDKEAFRARLYDDYHIEVPITQLGQTHEGPHYVRVSFQAYNTQADADHLLAALADLL